MGGGRQPVQPGTVRSHCRHRHLSVHRRPVGIRPTRVGTGQGEEHLSVPDSHPGPKKGAKEGPLGGASEGPEWALPLRLRDRVRSQAGDGGSWQGSAYGARGGSATHSREGRSGTPQCPRGSVLWLIRAAPAAAIAGKERRVKFSRESYSPFFFSFFFFFLFSRESEATLRTSKSLEFLRLNSENR